MDKIRYMPEIVVFGRKDRDIPADRHIDNIAYIMREQP